MVLYFICCGKTTPLNSWILNSGVSQNRDKTAFVCLFFCHCIITVMRLPSSQTRVFSSFAEVLWVLFKNVVKFDSVPTWSVALSLCRVVYSYEVKRQLHLCNVCDGVHGHFGPRSVLVQASCVPWNALSQDLCSKPCRPCLPGLTLSKDFYSFLFIFLSCCGSVLYVRDAGWAHVS